MTVSVEKPAPSTVMVCPFCITLLIMICAPIGTDTPLLLSVNWPMPPLLLMRNELEPVGSVEASGGVSATLEVLSDPPGSGARRRG